MSLKEYIKSQTEGFINCHKGLVEDMGLSIKCITEFGWKECFLSIFSLLVLALIWVICLFMYFGAVIVTAISLGFKYMVNRIRNIFNGSQTS